MTRKKKAKKSKQLTFTCNVEIYDKHNKLVNTGILTCSLGIPKWDIQQIDLNAVTTWKDE